MLLLEKGAAATGGGGGGHRWSRRRQAGVGAGVRDHSGSLGAWGCWPARRPVLGHVAIGAVCVPVADAQRAV